MLGARDFSSAVSVFCQVFIVTRAKSLGVFSRGFAVRAFGLEPKISRPSEIPAAREKNLWCRLFTVFYLSVSSSRSSALCYRLQSCMSVKTT